METRTCNTCFISKPINSFEKHKLSLNGYRVKCKECDYPRKHNQYLRNKEKYKMAY